MTSSFTLNEENQLLVLYQRGFTVLFYGEAPNSPLAQIFGITQDNPERFNDPWRLLYFHDTDREELRIAFGVFAADQSEEIKQAYEQGRVLVFRIKK